jgi:hypothetical protein
LLYVHSLAYTCLSLPKPDLLTKSVLARQLASCIWTVLASVQCHPTLKLLITNRSVPSTPAKSHLALKANLNSQGACEDEDPSHAVLDATRVMNLGSAARAAEGGFVGLGYRGCGSGGVRGRSHSNKNIQASKRQSSVK